MAASTSGISGLGLGVVTVGGLLVYAGIQNVPLIDALREIIRQKKTPTPGAQAKVLGPSLGGGGLGVDAGIGQGTGTGAQGAAIVAEAAKHLGKPYKWATAGPNTFDCSGLTSYVLIKLGLQKHRMVTSQYLIWTGAKDVPRAQAQPGDLACWPGHIGIVTGRNEMIHAPRTGQPVQRGKIDSAARGVLRIRRVNPAGISNAQRERGAVRG